MADVPERITCRTYTHARRHPMVLGRIAGWAPPFQLSATQIGVLLVTFGGAVKTWQLWGSQMPDLAAAAVLVGLPALLTWSVRHLRIEGRSLIRAAAGWASLWSTPANGTLHGRSHRDPRPTTWARTQLLIADIPDAGTQVVDNPR